MYELSSSSLFHDLLFTITPNLKFYQFVNCFIAIGFILNTHKPQLSQTETILINSLNKLILKDRLMTNISLNPLFL